MGFPIPKGIQNYHADTYPGIDPTSSRLSTAGKQIVISGGGSGIGAVIARSFAKSGADSVSILGRTEKTLIETKTQLETDFPRTKIYTYVADIIDGKALARVFTSIKSAVGQVDVLVANAGHLPTVQPIAESELGEWFSGFEVNVKGNYNLVTAFVPIAAKDAAIINISTGVTNLAMHPGYSAYHTSKLAAAKFFEYVHHEYPDFFVLNIHPGMIKTAMNPKASAAGVQLPYDNVALPADFVVWAVSREARYLNGKFVWAHWDVNDLQAMSQELAGTERWTFGLHGYP